MRTRNFCIAALVVVLGMLALLPSAGWANPPGVVVVVPQPAVSYYYDPAPAPVVSYYYAPAPRVSYYYAPAVSYYYPPAPVVVPRTAYYAPAPVAVSVTPRLFFPNRPRVTYWY